jgi:hypothetical protein
VATPSYFKGVAEISLRRVTLALPAIMAHYPAVLHEQIQKCGNACKKRKTGKESTFVELETVLFTWYQHSVTDADRENILSLEKSYFQLRQNSSKKQKTMNDFFVKKGGFPD